MPGISRDSSGRRIFSETDIPELQQAEKLLQQMFENDLISESSRAHAVREIHDRVNEARLA
jgi:hypothetical protein